MNGDQSSIPSTPRFIRPDAEVGETPKKLPRFIIPDDEARPRTPRFSRPAPEETEPTVEAPVTAPQFELSEGAAEVEAPPVAEVPEVETHEPEAAPAESVEADTAEFEAVTAEPEATEEPVAAEPEPVSPFQPEQIQSSGPTPRLGVTEPASPRPAPFWERGDQPTQPLRPALGFPEPELVSPEPEMWPPAATEPAAEVAPEPIVDVPVPEPEVAPADHPGDSLLGGHA